MKRRDMDKWRWREAVPRIRGVLLEEWDPIGIRDEPLAQDEYDRTIGRLYRRLMVGATAEEIIALLREIETDQMGLDPAGMAAGSVRSKLFEGCILAPAPKSRRGL